MKKIILFLTFLIVSLTIQATTYYISTSGTDGSGVSGTISTPWHTLPYAISRVGSGDIIHMVAGTYALGSSQIAVPVGISIEGDGVTTILNSTVSSDYTLALVSSTQGTAGNQHISNLKMSGGSGVNSYNAYSPVEIIERSNVSIYNCTFQYFSYRGPRFAGTSTDGIPSTYSTGNSFHDNIVTDCCNFVSLGSPYGSGQGGLEIGGQLGMFVYNNTITVPYRSGGLNGYPIKYCMTGYNKGLKIYNNTLTRPPYSGISNDFCFSMELWNCRGGIEIYGNTFNGAIDMSGDAAGYVCDDEAGYGFACKVYNNIIGFSSWQTYEQVGVDIERAQTGGMYIYDNNFNYLSSPVTLLPGWDSRFHDVVQQIYIYSNIANNIGYSSDHYDANFLTIEHIPTDAGPNILYDHIYLINNSVLQGSGGGGTEGFINAHLAGTASYFYIQNNIIDGLGAAGGAGAICVDGSNEISFTHITHQNNLYYSNYVNGFGYYYGGSASFDANNGNIIGDPKFVSTSDFHLQSGSPAIGKGVHITTPSIYTSDYDNVTLGNPPEIGAYEYGSYSSPTVTTAAITGIGTTTATSGGNVTSDGGASVTAKGVCWNTTANPVVSGSHTSDGTGTGSYASSITGLTASTVYHVRAYATNSQGTAYGADVQFTSGTASIPVTGIAVAGTGGATTLTLSSGTSYGSELITTGDFSSSTGWTTANGTTITGGVASFNTATTYAALLSQNIAISYGNSYLVQFDVSSYASGTARCLLGDVNTANTPNNIDYNSIGHVSFTQVADNVSAPASITFYDWGTGSVMGIDNVSVKQVLSTSGTLQMIATITPSNATNQVITWSVTNGSGSATINSSGLLTGVSAGTVTVRATATDGSGVYGTAVITLLNSTTAPTVTTTAITGIATTTATGGGNVTADGGASVTARGVCWATSSNPTTAGLHTSDGSGTGVFTSSITGLTASTGYHVRAYASNSVGTNYGSDVQFTSGVVTSTTPVTYGGRPVTSAGKILVIVR